MVPWHAHRVETTWLKMAKAGLAKLRSPSTGRAVLRLGSICAGSDIGAKVLEELAKFWEETYDLKPDVEVAWQCEKCPKKQAHLKLHVEADHLFSDAKSLRPTGVLDEISGKVVLVPYVDLLMAGFPCTRRSPLSWHAKDNLNCVQSGTGSTGAVFSEVLEVISSSLPSMVVLENAVPARREERRPAVRR